jgi:hypothetical protein
LGAQRQLISNVGVGLVIGVGVVGLNIETIDVPSIRICLVQNNRRIIVVQNVRGISACTHRLTQYSRVRNDEVLGEGAGEVVVLPVCDRSSESYLNFHQICTVV